MEKIQKKLANIIDRIEEEKKDLAVLEGQHKEAFKNLREILGVDTLDLAEDKLSGMEVELKELEKEIRSGYKELEENYSWLKE